MAGRSCCPARLTHSSQLRCQPSAFWLTHRCLHLHLCWGENPCSASHPIPSPIPSAALHLATAFPFTQLADGHHAGCILPDLPPHLFIRNCSQAHCDWGTEPPGGAWQAAHAMVTLAGHLADVLADADRAAAGSSSTAARSSAAVAGSRAAPAAGPAAAGGVTADAIPAGPTGSGGGGSPTDVTDADSQAAWRAHTAAAVQPDTSGLVVLAVAGAVVVTSWTAAVLERVHGHGAGVSAYSDRLERM